MMQVAPPVKKGKAAAAVRSKKGAGKSVKLPISMWRVILEYNRNPVCGALSDS